LLKQKFIESVVAEDIGRGDLFARISQSKEITAYIIAKSDGVLGGVEYINSMSNMYNIDLKWLVGFNKGDKLLYIFGSSKTIFSLLPN